MLKACIETISTGEIQWLNIPDENLSEKISFYTKDRDWECAIVTGLKEDGITSFVSNSFHKCDLLELNNLLINLQDECTFAEIEDYVVLNLFLEDNNCDCKEVEELIRNKNFRIYRKTKDMEQVAIDYLEDNGGIWYDELKRAGLEEYFDYKSYGEEVLGSSGTWLQDKYYEIIVEVYE